MKTKDAKKGIREGARYYLVTRAVFGEHFAEWRAADHLLKRLEKVEKELREYRSFVKHVASLEENDTKARKGKRWDILSDVLNSLIHEASALVKRRA